MTFVPPKDRVMETSTSNSQTVFALAGAVDSSFNRFNASMSVGDTTIGAVVEPGVAFKSGVITYSATNQITIDSTGFESKGSFSASGTKEVFMGLPAKSAILVDGPQSLSAAQKRRVRQNIDAPAAGNCYLSLSGSDLLLSRQDGKHLLIDGALEEIPSAGLTLSATGITLTNGVSGGPLQYIYAFINAGVMTLERSTTGHVRDTTTGEEIKSGDPSRSFVGMWGAASGGVWSTVATMGASWFNPKRKAAIFGPNNPSTTLTSIGAIPFAISASFVTFADRAVSSAVSAVVTHNVATATQYLDLGVDGSNTGGLPAPISFQQSSTGNMTPVNGTFDRNYSEGVHSLTPIGYTSTGTLSYNTLATTVAIFG